MAGDEERFPWPRAQEARDYLAKHKILELFDNVTSQLIYERPDNPKEFLIKQLEELAKAKTTNMDHPCLFDESNIQSVFSMLDPTNKGVITLQQYKEAMTTLGIKGFDQQPPGSEADRVTYDSFSREAKIGLTRMSSTYHK